MNIGNITPNTAKIYIHMYDMQSVNERAHKYIALLTNWSDVQWIKRNTKLLNNGLLCTSHIRIYNSIKAVLWYLLTLNRLFWPYIYYTKSKKKLNPFSRVHQFSITHIFVSGQIKFAC